MAFDAAENAKTIAIKKLLISLFTLILLVTTVLVLGKNWPLLHKN
jgi:hypothetical protein